MNAEDETDTTRDEQPLAPWLPIPSRAISAVEHPCIVKNIDKSITSLGGPVKLSKAGTG
jgi:general transcription factor 3C polypeptide 5 (transcription factor C subunit 1)